MVVFHYLNRNSLNQDLTAPTLLQEKEDPILYSIHKKMFSDIYYLGYLKLLYYVSSQHVSFQINHIFLSKTWHKNINPFLSKTAAAPKRAA